eukprot:2434719-Pyramimonas_sp.AAC.1
MADPGAPYRDEGRRIRLEALERGRITARENKRARRSEELALLPQGLKISSHDVRLIHSPKMVGVSHPLVLKIDEALSIVLAPGVRSQDAPVYARKFLLGEGVLSTKSLECEASDCGLNPKTYKSNVQRLSALAWCVDRYARRAVAVMASKHKSRGLRL